MIQGVGIDIVEIGRIARMWNDYGARFAQRVLTPDEYAGLDGIASPERLIAKRFAVKEAFGKAIGTGLRYPITLSRIGITHDTLGRPQLQLHPAIGKLLESRGISRHHVSISDERQYASAVVILES